MVRETPLAFTIDEMAEGPAAERRVSDLRELGIPAYVLGILYSDESTAHRVLAGAYADPSEAEYLGGILSDHELELCSQSLFRFADLGDDGLCRGGPDKGCGVIVSAIDVVVDRLD